MGALVGLCFGLGLLLIWAAFFLPRPSRPASTGPGRLKRRLARAGMANVSPNGFLGLCALTGGLVAFLVQAVSATPTVAVAFGLMGCYLPVAVVAGRIRTRQRDFAEVWPEAVDNLASAVRAGMSLPEGLSALAERGPEPLRPSFEQFSRDYRATGRFTDALDRLKEHLADPVGDRVVEGLRIAREVGGGELGRLLRNLSGYLREEMHTRSELEARQSWAVNGARLAVAAPWLVLLLLCFQPEVIQRYSSPGGATVLIGGAVACLVAYRLMMRIGRLPVERRILG